MVLDRFRTIYLKYGDKAVYPPLYFIFLIFHILGGQGMAYPAVDPNELGVIAVSRFLVGNDWSGVMSSVSYYYGFLQGVIYVPVMLIFPTAELQYAAILVINSLLISFVPVIAYSLACKMKVNRFWKRIIIAFVAGGYCCYYAHTKFAWTETITLLLPWLIVYLVFKCGERKSKAGRFFMSLLLGSVLGISYAAHSRLLAVSLAVIISLILIRVFFGKKYVNFPSLIFSFVVFTCGALYLTYLFQLSLWKQPDSALLHNTLAEFFATFSDNIQNGGDWRIVQTLCGQLYYFVTSTWGIGAMAICIFAAVISSCITHRKSKEPHPYDSEISLFGFIMFFSVAFTIVFTTFYRFSNDGFYTYQDTMMFGRFLDGIIPFAFVFILVILFTYSVNLNKVLGSVAVLGVIFVAFACVSVPTIIECGATRISPVLALYPLRVGAASEELLTFDSIFLTMSMTFCVMAVFIVVISCTKKNRSIILSLLMTGLTVYSLIFISAVYLPICREESVQKNEAVCEISESVFNQDGAPTLTAYNLSRHDALMLCFLNGNVSVRTIYDIEKIPENSFVVVNSDEDVSALKNSRTPFLIVAQSDGLKLYAYGERAVAYMTSQDLDENEEAEVTVTSAQN